MAGTDWTADQMREELWAIYKESGADPDWADARHLNSGEALDAVKELRKGYDEALKEIPLSPTQQPVSEHLSGGQGE